MKILFLLRKSSNYSLSQKKGSRSGLLNSARMTKEELVEHLGVEADVRVCFDANSIDKELHSYKPDICILEALWVTPDKLKEIQKLHKKVQFVVRIHSEVPFLSNEGIAMEWIKGYQKIPNVLISFNSKEAQISFMLTLFVNFPYLPNIYENEEEEKNKKTEKLLKFKKEDLKKKRVVNIGCFGAVRPMKNHLFQAFVAISLGNLYGLKVRFHINGSRTEHGGDSVLKNLRALFEGTRHELIEHDWLERRDFLKLVSQMDVGMQLSFNESFNIVTADFVSQNIPIIVSPTISWMPEIAKASNINIKEAISKLLYALINPKKLAFFGKRSLNKYNIESLKYWKEFIFL